MRDFGGRRGILPFAEFVGLVDEFHDELEALLVVDEIGVGVLLLDLAEHLFKWFRPWKLCRKLEVTEDDEVLFRDVRRMAIGRKGCLDYHEEFEVGSEELPPVKFGLEHVDFVIDYVVECLVCCPVLCTLEEFVDCPRVKMRWGFSVGPDEDGTSRIYSYLF